MTERKTNHETLTTCIKHLAVSGLLRVSARIKSSCNLIGNRFEMPNVSYTQPLKKHSHLLINQMENSYQILPFRFERFNDTEYFLTNDVGEFQFLKNTDFEKFVNQRLDTQSDTFFNLKSSQMLTDTELNVSTR